MHVRKCVPVALTKAQAMTTKRKKRIDKRILLEPFLTTVGGEWLYNWNQSAIYRENKAHVYFFHT